MNTQQLITHLRSLDVRLWTDGDQLRFRAASGVLTAELRSQLSERKAEIVKWLQEAASTHDAETPALVPVARDRPLPLSFGQQRLWFMDRFVPDHAFYNVPVALRFRGTLDLPALQQAMNQLVSRHEALRTSFQNGDDGPTQVIREIHQLELPVLDLEKLPSHEREREAQRIAAEEGTQSFNLSQAPSIRAQLLRLDEEDHVLLLTVHHIAADGWSLELLDRELSTLYTAFSTQKDSPLPPLAVQYADYAAWQRKWLDGETLSMQIAYWKDALANLSTLDLPTDRPRPDVPTFRGAQIALPLPNRLRESLQKLSQDEGVTLFMTTLAAFKVLLHRYCDQTDIVVGTPIANRTRSEFEGVVGYFANNIILRTNTAGDPSFRELLSRVKEVALEAYEHQEMPFDRLVEELEPHRNLSRNPLFQVSFALQNPPIQTRQLGECSIGMMPLHCHTTHFDLELHVWDDGQTITLSCIHSTDLFDTATVNRMLQHLEVLLEDIVSDPDQQLSELRLMPEEERRQLLVDWNQTHTDYPREATVQQLFQQQAAATPDASAVRCDGQHLTYGELNQRANQLARYLQKLGVGPEVTVGVCVERSVEMVVGMLGILKAGGAYVPLEPSYPESRLAFMIEDADTAVLLTQRHLSNRLLPAGRKLVFLDSEKLPFEQESGENVASGSNAENLAYVIYTSGSTGQPKGVCVEHRPITRLVCNTNYIQITAADRIAQASNASFDAATFEIWGALLQGAQLSIVPRDVTLEPAAFENYLLQQQISVLFLTTALFNQMAREAPGAFRGLRSLLFGGEAVNPHWVREVLQQQPPQRLLHVYGPTETTTFATYARVQEVVEDQATVPIGRPLSNTLAYVLDADRQPVPVGVAGELYLGGDALARGYLNQQALTNKRFVPHSFQPDARLYRTGDRVRYRADGQIEFLGRFDDQVKIRGFRVEPAEIEATLKTHEGVSEAAVLCREDDPGEKRLVAYVVGSDGCAPSITEVRDYARTKLPEFMIPSAFLPLESLPLTPNGKVDRPALLGLSETSRPESAPTYAPPRSPLENRLAAIWCEVLELERVGIRDDFFELGGHSLLATLVVSRVRAQLDIDLAIRVVFECPTIADLAAYLEDLTTVTGSSELGESHS